MLKKITSLVIALVMLASFAACDAITVKEDSSALWAEETKEIHVEVETMTEPESSALKENEIKNNEQTTAVIPKEYEPRKVKVSMDYFGYYTNPEDPQAGLTPMTYNGEALVVYLTLPPATQYQQEGIFVMIDGIRQNIRVERDGVMSEETQMYICEMIENRRITLKIYVSPNVGKKGDTVNLMIHNYTYPTFVPAEKMFSAFTEGYHSDSMTGMYPVPVYMNADSVNTETVCKNYSGATTGEFDSVFKRHLASNEIERKLGLMSPAVGGSIAPDGVFYKNIEQNVYKEYGALVTKENVEIEGKENEKLSLALYEQIGAYTGEFSGEFRVSLYIDHELMNVFDGCNYADIRIEKGKQTTLEFELDTSELPEYSRCYVILVKLDGENSISHKIDCRLDKTA